MNKNEKHFFGYLFKKNIHSKNEINSLLRSKYELNLPLTNKNNKSFIGDSYSFSYNYQRFDSNLKYNNFENDFYNINEFPAKTVFTNCGMSSIFCILYAISRLGNYKVIYEKDIYFETQKLIKSLKLTRGKKIIYYDSISDFFEFDSNEKNKIIIIDTTCYHSYDFNNFIIKLLNNNNFVILVRSHVKLDMLGLEYAFLGSMTFFLSNKTNKRQFDNYKKIIMNAINICGSIGTYATEKNIFPLLSNKQFMKLTKDRVKRINENNKYFYEKNKENSNLTLHRHNLFLTLIVDENDTEKLIETIKEITIGSKGLCYYSSSFGFDYIALDTYFDLNNNKNTIRISIGDIDRKKIDRFIDYFKEKLNDKI